MASSTDASNLRMHKDNYIRNLRIFSLDYS
jgi:hypothetical protein